MIVKDFPMSAAQDPKRSPKLRGDLAGMAEALAQFAEREFPQAEPARNADCRPGAVLQ